MEEEQEEEEFFFVIAKGLHNVSPSGVQDFATVKAFGTRNFSRKLKFYLYFKMCDCTAPVSVWFWSELCQQLSWYINIYRF